MIWTVCKKQNIKPKSRWSESRVEGKGVSSDPSHPNSCSHTGLDLLLMGRTAAEGLQDLAQRWKHAPTVHDQRLCFNWQMNAHGSARTWSRRWMFFGLKVETLCFVRLVFVEESQALQECPNVSAAAEQTESAALPNKSIKCKYGRIRAATIQYHGQIAPVVFYLKFYLWSCCQSKSLHFSFSMNSSYCDSNRALVLTWLSRFKNEYSVLLSSLVFTVLKLFGRTLPFLFYRSDPISLWLWRLLVLNGEYFYYRWRMYKTLNQNISYGDSYYGFEDVTKQEHCTRHIIWQSISVTLF